MTTFDDMVEFLDLAYPMKDQIVPCLIGPVGIGKTAAVNQHAENVGAGKVITIIASQILPNEVSGITMPDADTKAMEIYDHFRLSSLKDGDILFFDELLEADQMVLSACLTLIESRQMMSGKPLPDIQIIGATNPTILPTMLKENIRQRFLFKDFKIDKEGCREFIKKDCGIDVGSLVDMLKATGDEYNILSQRSLTKMARWMAKTSKEDSDRTAQLIDSIWNCQIGTKLKKAMYQTPKSMKMDKAKECIANAAKIALYPDTIKHMQQEDKDVLLNDKFEDATLEEMFEICKKFHEFSEIQRLLSEMEDDEEEETDNITF